MPDSSGEPSFLRTHFHIVSVETVTHYRYMDTGPGAVTARDMYYKVQSRVQLDLIGEGRTYLQARGESGRTFQASYDYAGPGMHDGYWSFNLKSLYLGQKIGNHWEAQAGGLEYDQGSGTEMTYADNDAWLEGYRLRYTGQINKFAPDRIGVTVGYVGDFLQPNAFARFHRMGEENYIQVLASRKLSGTRDVSAEFDSFQEVRYTREAFNWKKMPVPLVQDMTLEAITRASDNATFGWSGSLSRALDQKSRMRLGMFYSDMPAGMFLKDGSAVFLNGDCYLPGKRIGPTIKVVPFPNAEISLFGGARVDNTVGTRYRGQVAFRYQFASLLNRAIR
ncbi:MAG TPA: hypothetical protein VGF06_13600 [Terriglobales bacterium]|jgi:hypothetical protein